MTPDDLKRAVERLRGPAEYALTYRMPDDTDDPENYPGSLMIPLDTPLAALLEAAADHPCEHYTSRQGTTRWCRMCEALARLVAAINGEEGK